MSADKGVLSVEKGLIRKRRKIRAINVLYSVNIRRRKCLVAMTTAHDMRCWSSNKGRRYKQYFDEHAPAREGGERNRRFGAGEEKIEVTVGGGASKQIFIINMTQLY